MSHRPGRSRGVAAIAEAVPGDTKRDRSTPPRFCAACDTPLEGGEGPLCRPCWAWARAWWSHRAMRRALREAFP